MQKYNPIMQAKINKMISDMRGVVPIALGEKVAVELVRAGWVKTTPENAKSIIEITEPLKR